MRNPDVWRPTKFALADGQLSPSTDQRELNQTSSLGAGLVAQFYNRVFADFAHGRLLDLGCGKQPMYGAYEKYVDEVFAVDWPSSLHSNPNMDAYVDLAKPLPFRDESFDTVLFSDVLEHLPDSELAMKEIARVLRSGGTLLMNVPFLYWIHEAPHDYYRHTHFSLSRLAGLAGLEVVVLVQLGGLLEVAADILGKALPNLHKDGHEFGAAIQRYLLDRQVASGQIGSAEDPFPLGYGMVATKRAS